MKQLLGLAKDTQENKDDIKAVQTRLETATETLQRVIYELQRLKENEAHEREKMSLRLENTLLRAERALPPGNASDQPNMAEVQSQIIALQKERENLNRRINQLGNNGV